MSVKLKPGVSHAAIDAEFQSLFEQFAKETPKHFPADGFRVNVQGFNDRFMKELGPTLYLLLGSVALLLLIGCGNVSILLLARGTAREHEFAVRAAVGAGRSRLLRQLLTESLVLSLSGAALGVLLAYRLVAVIVPMLPESSFPHEAAIRINLPVLCFSVGLAILTGVFFGLSPAMQFSRPEVSQVMQASTKKVHGRRARQAHAQHAHRRADRADPATAGQRGCGHPGVHQAEPQPSGLQPAQRDVGGHSGPRQHLHHVGIALAILHPIDGRRSRPCRR